MRLIYLELDIGIGDRRSLGNSYSVKAHTHCLVTTAIEDQLKVAAGEIHAAIATLLCIVVTSFYPDLNRVWLSSLWVDCDAEQIAAGQLSIIGSQLKLIGASC